MSIEDAIHMRHSYMYWITLMSNWLMNEEKNVKGFCHKRTYHENDYQT